MWLAVELVPGPLEFTSTKKCKSDHGTWGPQKAFFRLTVSTNMVQRVLQWEAKMVLTPNIKGPCQRNAIFIRNNPLFYLYFKFFIPAQPNIIVLKRKEGKKGASQTWRKKSQNCSFWTLKKKSSNPLLAHGHFSWSTVGLHLVKGPKCFKKAFFRNWTMEVWPWKKAIWHGTTLWSMM